MPVLFGLPLSRLFQLIATTGVPAGLCIYLVLWGTTVLSTRMIEQTQMMQATNQSIVVLAGAVAEVAKQHIAAAETNSQILRVLQVGCVNEAKTEIQRRECLSR